MYYIEESHEPIIPPDEFDAVQAEIERRKEMGKLCTEIIGCMKFK